MSIKNLDELKAVVNVAEVIKAHIPLKRVSGTLKGLCPFHTEKTPSFAVDERRGFFHCFGCKESGDAFTFLQKFKHIDFAEAVKEVAEFYDFELEYNGTKTEKRKDYTEFLARLNQHFKENLLDDNEQASKIRQWLKNRGLDESDLNRYDIGLVDDNFKLKEFIGTDRELAEKLGILIKNTQGETYSQFANRVSFALRGYNFQIQGFSCRTHPYLNFRNSGKYINSRESFLFKKSNFLYNLIRAKEAYFTKNAENPEQKKQMVIVEGFMDSIALSKFGLKSNVAACGTAFNQTHLATLMRNEIENFALCFDKDEAGEKAALKTCELLFRHSYYESEVWILRSDFKDIGEVLEKHTKDGTPLEMPDFEKINAFEYYVKTRLNKCENARKKDIFIAALLKSVRSKNNYFIKDFCLGVIERVTGFEFKKSPRVNLQGVNFDAEKTLFKSILSDSANAYIAFEMLYASFFENYQESYLKFKEKGEKDDTAKGLLVNDSVAVVKGADFSELCKSFKKAFLNKELEKAKIARNYSLIISLQNKIAQIA